jgi:hypothetical protein
MTSAMWYRAPLTSEQVAAGHVEIARRLFADAIQDTPSAAGACLFVTSREGGAAGPLDEAADDAAGEAQALFFSPQSISAVPHLIAQYGARPSEPPDRSRAELLVGEERDWDLLPHASH